MLRIQDDRKQQPKMIKIQHKNQMNEPGVCLTCVTIGERHFVQVELLVLHRYSSLFHYIPYI